MTLIDSLRAEARAAPESGIVAVVNYGRVREGLIPLWAGEGDLPTPAFITDAATRGAAPPARPSTPGSAAFPDSRRRWPATTRRHFGKTVRRRGVHRHRSGMQAIQLALAGDSPAPATRSSI